MTTEIRYCEAVLIRETRTDPAELCEEEAEPDSDYCARHGERDDDTDPSDFDWPDEHSDTL